MQLRVKSVCGKQIGDVIADVARLRISVFREFPYLYDGTAEYEESYLQTYRDCDEAIVVLAMAQDQIVGASTALPMAYETDDFKSPLTTHGYDTKTVFYCAESVLLPAYRGHGIGQQFFTAREAHAKKLGGFRYSCFCAVDRPDDHPLRPAGYTRPEKLWRSQGYREQSIRTEYRWKDIDCEQETAKSMTYWLKHFAE